MADVILNWQKRYRIQFGVVDFSNIKYTTEGSLIAANVKSSSNSTQGLPSEAIKISNIPEDGGDVRGFDFSFSTKREMSVSSASKENTVLTIKNISEEMYNVLNSEGCIVNVEAGYRDSDLDVVYQGTVSRVEVSGSGNDVDYRIILKDGGLDIKKTKISVDFQEKDSLKTVFEALVKLLPSVSKTEFSIDALETIFRDGGFSYEGNLIDNIENICKKYGIVYSFFNSKFIARTLDLIQGSSDYNKLKPNTFVFPAANIKTLDRIFDNAKKASTASASTFQIQLNTFLTPIEFNNFFTVPKEVDSILAGTYKIDIIAITLNSRGNEWDTTLIGSPM